MRGRMLTLSVDWAGDIFILSLLINYLCIQFRCIITPPQIASAKILLKCDSDCGWRGKIFDEAGLCKFIMPCKMKEGPAAISVHPLNIQFGGCELLVRAMKVAKFTMTAEPWANLEVFFHQLYRCSDTSYVVVLFSRPSCNLAIIKVK